MENASETEIEFLEREIFGLMQSGLSGEEIAEQLGLDETRMSALMTGLAGKFTDAPNRAETESQKAMEARLSAVAPACPADEVSFLVRAAEKHPTLPVDDVIALLVSDFPGDPLETTARRFGMTPDMAAAFIEAGKARRDLSPNLVASLRGNK